MWISTSARNRIQVAQRELKDNGYTFLQDSDLFLSVEERKKIAENIFRPENLVKDHVMKNRCRTGDKLRYRLREDGRTRNRIETEMKLEMYELEEHHDEDGKIRYSYETDKNLEVPRPPSKPYRVLGNDPSCEYLQKLCRIVLHMVPHDARAKESGQVDIHFLHASGERIEPTEYAHRDGVDWVIGYGVREVGRDLGGEYFLSKHGKEAEDEVCETCGQPEDGNGMPKDVIWRSHVGEGQLVMFDDSQFFHYVNPLWAELKQRPAERNFIVMTIRPLPLQEEATSGPGKLSTARRARAI